MASKKSRCVYRYIYICTFPSHTHTPIQSHTISLFLTQNARTASQWIHHVERKQTDRVLKLWMKYIPNDSSNQNDFIGDILITVSSIIYVSVLEQHDYNL